MQLVAAKAGVSRSWSRGSKLVAHVQSAGKHITCCLGHSTPLLTAVLYHPAGHGLSCTVVSWLLSLRCQRQVIRASYDWFEPHAVHPNSSTCCRCCTDNLLCLSTLLRVDNTNDLHRTRLLSEDCIDKQTAAVQRFCLVSASRCFAVGSAVFLVVSLHHY
jgi:hypothetical protein